MNHFDLHCDTLGRCLRGRKSILRNDYDLSVERGLLFDKWIQVFAVFLDDDTRGAKAHQRFLAQAEKLRQAMEESDLIVPYDRDNIREGVCNAILAVENGIALGGRLERVAEFAELGVKIMTLVWNGENELGGGFESETGLTDFGRKAVRELEKHKIIVDVSHLSRMGFWDLCEIAERPFIASHSNCFEVCPHQRNLDDLQIKEIIRRGGLIGLNFFPLFINGESDASFQELRRHIRHILALGGEDCIAVGSDFDGAAMPSVLAGVDKIPDWHKNLLKHFEPDFVEKITFGNAERFFRENL
ncbi:MAG: membrane dipeptidase [Oscillospiraceae bacterium]|nr:membrane dipeptidase [Oscillospiraceae bacterium]